MATITRVRIGRADRGRRMTLAQFIVADFEGAHHLYELARGVIVVTNTPGIPHGRIVGRVTSVFVVYDVNHPGVINYRAGGGECRLRVPGMKSDRHPDQAVYLTPPPPGPDPWTRWMPDLVVEVVSWGSKKRDNVEKREEYLRAGVREYWIIDPAARVMKVLQRAGDVWEEVVVAAGATYRTHLLPGLEVRPADLIGPG
jgi:Uma2 family endonuclease